MRASVCDVSALKMLCKLHLERGEMARKGKERLSVDPKRRLACHFPVVLSRSPFFQSICQNKYVCGSRRAILPRPHKCHLPSVRQLAVACAKTTFSHQGHCNSKCITKNCSKPRALTPYLP